MIRSLLGRREMWVVALIVMSAIVVGLLKPSFLSIGNLRDILADAAPVAIIACAVTLVIVTAEIDISVGSMLALSAAVLGLCCYGSDPAMPVWLGATLAIATATAIGMVNGVLVTVGRVPSIIVTLGMMTVLRGVTQLVMEGRAIEGRPTSLETLATGRIAGVPISILVAGIIVALTIGLVRYTPIGLRVYAVGSNARAATLAGVSVAWTKFFCFTLVGLFTGIATLLYVPRNSLVQTNVGTGLELSVVTCVVVGGTAISGGVGTIAGSVLAAVLFAMVPQVLVYLSAPPSLRMAVEGVFILAAVLADHLVRSRRKTGHGGDA